MGRKGRGSVPCRNVAALDPCSFTGCSSEPGGRGQEGTTPPTSDVDEPPTVTLDEFILDCASDCIEGR